MKRFLSVLVLALVFPVSAQDREIQTQLIQRQQQSDAFNLQLRQSQEALKAAPAAKPELETRQLSERQRLESVSEKQLLEVKPDTPQELRPYERQKTEDERRSLTTPPKEIPQRTENEPRPLPASQGGIFQVIEAPR